MLLRVACAGLLAMAVAACRGDGERVDATPLAEVVAWGGQRLATPITRVRAADSAVVAGGAQRSPAPAALPPLGKGAHTPGAAVLSLLDRFAETQVESQWQAPSAARPLVAVERSAPADRGKLVRFLRRRPGGVVFVGRRFLGFNIDAAEVGAIELDVDPGQARELVITWSRVASITIPVEAGRRRLRLPTDGLPDWKGELSWLAVAVPEAQAKGLVVEGLQLLPRAEAFPERAARRRVQLHDQLRHALYVHVPATITWPNLPEVADGRLSFAAGAPAGQGRIAIVSGAEPLEVSLHDRWQEVRATQTSGGALQLRLDGPPGAVVCIANPVLYRAPAQPRRVLLYLIDTLGAKHMSLYGYHRPTTPNLAELAAGGVWFANAFANGSRTVESVTTLMTGLPAVSHGVIHSFARVAPDLPLLAEQFGRAGFATLAFSTNINAGPRQGLERGFDLLIDRMSFYWDQDDSRTVDIDAVLGWMDDHRDRDQFVYIHTAEPHAPYAAPAGFANRFDPDYQGQINGQQTDLAFGFPKANAPRDVEHVVALYDEEVTFADHRFGELMRALAAADLTKDMTVAVTADHGEEFREHGQWTHGGNLHSETVRVPLIVSSPLLSKEGARGRSKPIGVGGKIEAPVQLMDVAETLLELGGAPALDNGWGSSLMPLLRGGEQPRPAIVASTYQPQNPHHSLLRMPWRLIFAPGRDPSVRPFLLFHIEEDPDETRDRLAAEPEVGKRMIRELVELYEQQPRRGGSGAVEVDPAQLERLRALGYER